LWYRNRGDNDKKRYLFDNYRKYNEIFFGETILPKNKKSHLDNLVDKMFSDKNSEISASLIKTDEYRYMLCNFYEIHGLEKPVKLQCNS
jgi:hypothetical protein